MAAKRPSRRAQIAAGILAIAAGLGLAAVAAGTLGKPINRLDPVVILISGCVLVFTGGILAAPERRAALRAWIGALMITSIALLFDWVAFGPGEPRVTSGISNSGLGARTHFWEMPGRVLLVSGAVLFNLMALWAWMRAVWKRAARA